MKTKRPARPDDIDVIDHDRIVKRVVHQFFAWALHERYRVCFDRDDLLQAGRVGLIAAKDRWDPARGAWTTCAYWQVRGAVWDFIRHAAGTPGGNQFHATARVSSPDRGDDEGDDFFATVAQPDADLEDTTYGVEFRDMIDRLFYGVKPRHRHAAYEHIVMGRTLESIKHDDCIGVVTRERVRQLVEKAKDGMRANAKRAGLGYADVDDGAHTLR